MNFKLIAQTFTLSKTVATSPTHRLVLAALAYHADETCTAWPSVLCLKHETGLSKSSILRALAHLEKMHLIVVSRLHRKTNRYRLVLLSESVGALSDTSGVSSYDSNGQFTTPNRMQNETPNEARKQKNNKAEKKETGYGF